MNENNETENERKENRQKFDYINNFSVNEGAFYCYQLKHETTKAKNNKIPRRLRKLEEHKPLKYPKRQKGQISQNSISKSDISSKSPIIPLSLQPLINICGKDYFLALFKKMHECKQL